MSAAAEAKGTLTLDIAGFSQAITTAKRLMAGLVATFGAYKIEQFFVGGVKGAIDFGKEMQSASRAMGGFDPGQLLLTQKALEKTGMGAEEARGHIGDFIKEGRHLSDLFVGKGDLGNALQSASEEYGKQADVLSRSGAKLQSVWNTIESVSSKVKTFFLSMTESFVLPLQAALDYLNQLDLSGMGERFGKSISNAATTLLGLWKNGDLWNAAKAGLQWAFLSGVDTLFTGIKKVVAFFGAALKSITESFGKSFFPEDLVTMLKDIFKGLAELFGAHLSAAIGKALWSFGKHTANPMALIAGATLMKDAIQGKTDAGNHFRAAQNVAEDMNWSNAWGDGKKAIAEGFKASGQIHFGESENSRDAERKWDEMRAVLERGFSTGTGMESASRKKHAGDELLATHALTNFSGSSSHVIADSLARVGGGGNYLRVGQSLAEKTYQLQKRAQAAAEETKNAAKSIDKKMDGMNAPETLGR